MCWKVHQSHLADLRIGMTSADFQTCANVLEENEVLTRFVIAESVIGKLSFSTLAVTLSRPGVLFDGKDQSINQRLF